MKLSSVTFEISKVYEDYNSKSSVCKLPNNQKIYSSFNSSFKNLAEYYRIQSVTVKTSLIQNVKWNHEELEANQEVSYSAPEP